jgi:hypothetical protein
MGWWVAFYVLLSALSKEGAYAAFLQDDYAMSSEAFDADYGMGQPETPEKSDACHSGIKINLKTVPEPVLHLRGNIMWYGRSTCR